MARRKIQESAVQRAIIEALLYDGWLVMRVNAGAATFDNGGGRYVRFVRWQAIGFSEDEAGVPDVIAFKDGRGLLIEVKGYRGRLRKSQKQFKAAAEQVGAIYFVARSVDDLRPYLDRLEV